MLGNSRLEPVLVHFWSYKAAQGLRFHALLKNMAEAYGGGFRLVNINSDEQQRVTREYAITSTPSLKLFVNGQVVESLSGFQNEQDLRFLLDQYIASDLDNVIHDALNAYKNGDHEKAFQTLGRAALDNPGFYKLPLTIAGLMATEKRHEEALRLLLSLPESIRKKPVCAQQIIEQEFAWIAEPVKQAKDLEAFVNKNPAQLSAVAMLAAWYFTQKNFETALAYFLQIMKTDPGFENELGRRSIVNILNLLDRDDPLAQKYHEILHPNTD